MNEENDDVARRFEKGLARNSVLLYFIDVNLITLLSLSLCLCVHL